MNQQLEQDKKTVEEFLSKRENKEMAVQLAYQIQSEVGDHWFETSKLLKKFKLTEQQAQARIMVLRSFNLVACKAHKGKQLYKIDLDKKAQRVLILQEIEFHKAQVSILTDKLVKLD